MKNKNIFIVLFSILIFTCATVFLFGCKEESSPETFNVIYSSSYGGYVSGQTTQNVPKGESGSEVTAIVSTVGYVFDSWSDGVKDVTRKEENVTEAKEIKAIFRLGNYTIEYFADEGGHIEGKTLQIGDYYSKNSEVKAVANEGYKFIRWSDGNENPIRYDPYLQENKQITAHFEKITRTFLLNYNMVTRDAINEIELMYGETNKVTLPVLEKDKFTFCGWYRSEWDGSTVQVSDEYGNIIVEDSELFKQQEDPRNPLDRLHIKWEAKEKFAYTYKILMIYVTEVKASLRTQYNGKPSQDTVVVNYQISELERQICHNITNKLEEVLEDMLDGLVDFQIDEYFTTQAIGTESFGQDSGGNVSLYPWNIPEITLEQRQQYQSVLTTLNFNEYTHLFHSAAGTATQKYGCIYFESVVPTNLEDLKDLHNHFWTSAIGPYIHELCHTIEMRKDFYDFHSAAITNLINKKGMLELEAYKLYYLCEIEMDGQIIGIPYDFWKEDLENPYIERF